MPRLGMSLDAIRVMLGDGKIVGSPGFVCESVASLGRAGPDQLSFVKDQRHIDNARSSRAGALLVPLEIEDFQVNQLVVSDPYRSFGVVLSRMTSSTRQSRIRPGSRSPTMTSSVPS